MPVSRDNLFNKISKIFPFSLSTENSLEEVIKKSEVVYFEADSMIFMEGATANNFYIIFEGEVEILVEKNLTLRKFNSLNDGDYFGEDSLEKNKQRSSSARTIKNTLLIKIPKSVLDNFISNDTRLINAFSLIFMTYSNLLKFNFRDLSNETIYFIGKPHYFYFLIKSIQSIFITLIPSLILIILAANRMLSSPVLISASIAITFILLIQIFWHYFEWQNDYYIFTAKRVINIFRRLINYESKFEIPLSAINNLEIRKNIAGRGIGFGDLIIRTYTGETKLQRVIYASEVQQCLENLISMDKLTKRMEERKSFEKILNEKVFAKTSDTGAKILSNSESSNLFENNKDFEITIYHTHWIMLLRESSFQHYYLLVSFYFFPFYSNSPSFLANGFVFFSTGLIFIGTCLWWLYQFVDWENDQYHITPDQVIDIYRKPFGTED